MTNRLVTVLRRRVVMTDKITKVFPIIVIIINKQKSTISTIFVHGQLPASALFCSVAFIFNHRVEPSKLITREEKPDTSELLLTDDFRMLIHGFLISIGGELAPADNLKRQTRWKKKFYDSNWRRLIRGCGHGWQLDINDLMCVSGCWPFGSDALLVCLPIVTKLIVHYWKKENDSRIPKSCFD